MNHATTTQMELFNQKIKDLTFVYNQIASSVGISENEFWIWYALLVMEEEYTQQDICELWSLPKQTINSVITNLRKKELVYLEKIPGTKNRKIIRLTEKGVRFGEKVILPLYQAEQRTLNHMSEEERQQYIFLLSKYVSLLKEEVQTIMPLVLSSEEKEV